MTTRPEPTPNLPRRSLRRAAMGCTAIVALSPAALIAQEAADGALELAPIVVEGPGEAGLGDDQTIVATDLSAGSGFLGEDILDIPASVSVVTSEEMQTRGVQTTEEVLNYTAGANTNFYGGDDRFDNFRIRGFEVYTYRDGLFLNENFGAIREQPYAFDKVEILKGADSTLFGVSDPGGAVNFVTKLPRSEPFGEVYGTVGSFSRTEVGVDFGDTLTEDDTLSYRFVGLARSAERETDYSQNDERFVLGSVTWRPGPDTSLSLAIDDIDREASPSSGGSPIGVDLGRSTFLGEPSFNYRNADRTTGTLIFDHDFDGGLSVHASARYSETESDFGYAYVNGASEAGDTIVNRAFFASDNSRDSFVADARLRYDAAFGAFESTTVGGIEYRLTEATDQRRFGSAPSIDYRDIAYTGSPASEVPVFADLETEDEVRGAYLSQTLGYNDVVSATVGMRLNQLDLESEDLLAGTTETADIEETTTRAALTYKPLVGLATYVSYAQSVVPAGAGVDPERGEQYELGVKYRPEAFRALFSAAVYDLTKSNIARTDPLGMISTIGEVEAQGLEMEAKAEVADNLNLTAALSFIDAEIADDGVTENAGNTPQLVPERLASIWADYTLDGAGARGDMTFGAGVRFAGEHYYTDANATGKSDDLVVVDAAYSYDITEDVTFSARVDNVFDERVVAFGGLYADFYTPGREVAATLRYNW